MTTGKDVAAEIAFLARELKTPVITETFASLGDQAREAGWSHEEYRACQVVCVSGGLRGWFRGRG